MNNKLYYDTIGAMIHLLRKHRCKCEAEVKKFKIHHSQHKVLMHINRCGKKPPTQVEIAKHFRISAAAVAVTLKKLEAAGYITRCAREGDMRNNEVMLTPLGKETCKASKDAFDTIDAQVFRGFDDSEILIVKDYIDRMLDNLSEGGKE